jgi:acyl-CoA synthetase (NDP forming)
MVANGTAGNPLASDNATTTSDNATRAALRALFEPRHVAVIGASRTPGKIGHSVVHNLIRAGFPGRIFPINPAGGEVEGLACLRSAAELPDAVDCAMLVVPAKETVAAIRACADKGVHTAIIGAIGFAETGTAEGRERQEEVAELAHRAGMRSWVRTPTGSTTPAHGFRLATTPRTDTRSRPDRCRSSRTAGPCSAAWCAH